MEDGKQTEHKAQTAIEENGQSVPINQSPIKESLTAKPSTQYSEMKMPKVPLPEGVLRRMENFNEDLKRTSSLKNNEAQGDEILDREFPSLYERAHRFTDRLNADKKVLYEKSKKNFKLFMLLLLLFGVYYFYTANFTDRTSLAITSLRQQLPLQFDKDTALTAVELTSKELRLYVTKNAQAYAGLDVQAKAEAIARLQVNASPLCRNEAMHKIIAEGKRILVLLEADDGSFQREIAIEKCPQTE